VSIPLGSVLHEESLPHLGGFIHGGDGNTWCPEVWRELIADFNVRSVIDVGCGEGQSLSWFLSEGIDAVGVEGSVPAICLARDQKRIVLHDYTEAPYRPERQFDLCWCAEFVEHVEERCVSNYLATFRQASVVAMTHAAPGQEGWHHVNCQPTEYWVEVLQRAGFECDLAYSVSLRNKTKAEHVNRSLLVFRKHSC
jgi:SAM-dependent methyltransferase